MIEPLFMRFIIDRVLLEHDARYRARLTRCNWPALLPRVIISASCRRHARLPPALLNTQ
jgi:hypothetical protein